MLDFDDIVRIEILSSYDKHDSSCSITYKIVGSTAGSGLSFIYERT